MPKKTLKHEDDPLAGDMTEFIQSAHFKRALFEMRPKDTTMTLRMPRSLVLTAKRVAKKRGIKYQRMIRQAIVEYVAKIA